jgi:hypothetical protein
MSPVSWIHINGQQNEYSDDEMTRCLRKTLLNYTRYKYSMPEPQIEPVVDKCNDLN